MCGNAGGQPSSKSQGKVVEETKADWASSKRVVIVQITKRLTRIQEQESCMACVVGRPLSLRMRRLYPPIVASTTSHQSWE